jgi:hypothetical protein
MACDDEIIPSQQSIESVADDADLEEVYAAKDTCFTWLASVPAITYLRLVSS